MKASLDGREISPFDYLLMWIGAMGKTVGLDVQIELVLKARELRGKP